MEQIGGGKERTEKTAFLSGTCFFFNILFFSRGDVYLAPIGLLQSLPKFCIPHCTLGGPLRIPNKPL